MPWWRNFFGFLLVLRISTCYVDSQDYTGLHSVQEKTSQNFTARLEALKLRKELSDERLADRVGLSRRMLYLIRTGKSSITRKTWYKLEQAEREAGIIADEPPVAARAPPTMREDPAAPSPGDGEVVEMLKEILRRLDALEKKPKK
jgi:transcriptional regulator with XRE-family HTH domain